ncbi:MAG: hypothetical protein ACJ8GN_31060 [Longimicrobiaceae bacterium]
MHISLASRTIRIPAAAAAALVSASLAAVPGRPDVGIPAGPRADTGWVELPYRGRIGEVDVGPDGRLWMGSAQGEIFSADSVNGDWRMVAGPPPLPEDSFDLGIFLPHFDRVTWVGPLTAIASGNVGRGQSQTHDHLLRTTDGGVRWDTVSFGEDQWVYDAFVDRAGGVWIGGSTGTLLFSADSGRTWRKVASPFDGSRVHAIWIDDGWTGVVGALGNALAITRDAGRTGEPLPTPFDQRKYRPADAEDDDHRIEAVALVDGTLWVAQEGHTFTSPMAPVAWTEVSPGDPLRTFTVDRASGTVYALGASRHVYEIPPGGAPRRLAGAPLHAQAGRLSVRGGVVYTMDEEGGLYRISRDRTVYSRPLTRAAARPQLWHVAATAGMTYAASDFGVYATADSGRTWRLAGTAPHPIRDVLPLDDGRLMLWNGHGFNAAFDPGSGALEEIGAFGGADVVGVVAGDSLWVAFGGGQLESAGRVDVARTFYPGEFAGSGPNGFIYLSRDRGRTWTRAAEWPSHGVLGAFVHPEGSITLLSYLGALRRLTPEGAGYRAEDLVIATPRNRDSVPYVQELGAMYFDGRQGWIDGWIHHLGNRRYVTSDGGRTWLQKESRSHHYQGGFPLSGGWVGTTGHRLFRIANHAEREIFAAGGREASDWEGDVRSIRDAAPTADGGIAVLLRGGMVRRVQLPR